MITKLFSKIGLWAAQMNADSGSRRRHVRHAGVRAHVEGANISGVLVDWSLGGFSFQNPDNAPLPKRAEFTLQFRLPDQIITLSQEGRVVRQGADKVAVAFDQPSPDALRRWNHVLAEVHANNFARSQAEA